MEQCVKINSFSKIINPLFYRFYQKYYHKIPFLELYKKTTGDIISENSLILLKKKHPNIDILSHDRLQCSLQLLEKFGITPYEACQKPHIFSMNPITMDNYGEILKECGFIEIIPNHIIRYHTLVRNKSIEHLKKKGLIENGFQLEEALQSCFQEWPSSCKSLEKFEDSKTSILTVRMSVLQKYLQWRLSVTSEEFQKYCRNYLPLKHKPMSDIKQALDIAQNEFKFDVESIRRNGFIISSDPVKSKMMIENVKTLAGMNIKEVIKLEPAILKNNETSLLQIKSILEEYEISEEAQKNCLRVYCMKPQTVRERLDELKSLKEYHVLRTNPRALGMVVHKKKLMSRLTKIQDAKKQCYSFNNLVGSSKVFNNYINGFGNKVCGRDIAILISSSVAINQDIKSHKSETIKVVLKQLKKHKYWLHVALNVVNENIQFLKTKFSNDVIFNHCQLLLYPMSEIEYYLNRFMKLRNDDCNVLENGNTQWDASYNNLKYKRLTDDQILSLVLYEIEKKYHFSGDGIWARQDPVRLDSRAS